jgi:ubiquinone/menaquinone biosynthesis C-methylase UbiE
MKKNDGINKKIISTYDELIKQYGHTPQALGWGFQKGKQSLRFQILCEIGDLSNSSLLDIGCGFGDLYGYLQYKKIPIKYHGVDLNNKMIQIGKDLYPKIKFETRNILERKINRKFDWVFASGITTFGFDYKLIKKMLTEMLQISKKGVAMNFVGGVLDFKEKGIFYTDPEKIYSIAKAISNRITIRHDYAPYEYTIYVYKNNLKTKNSIFKEFLKDSKNDFDDKKWIESNKIKMYQNNL